MLIMRRYRMNRAPARGFSLIELMVATVIGMIVAAGAVGLIVAISRSNSETIQATRINQELRALASVISNEIKRGRRLHDPVVAVGQGASTAGTFDLIDTSQQNATPGDCILYGYQDTTLSDGVANEDAVNNYEAIYLSTVNGVGSIVFAKGTSAVGCTTAGTTLNSTQINVTGLTFSCVTTNGTSVNSSDTTSTAGLRETCNEINLTLSAKLISGDTYTTTITHTYVQQVFIRSGAVKTT
jgi:prepilin-type N-terminal cleavage/methylation domain-containing protein